MFFAKATRKPWRGAKTAKDRLDDKVASKPGQVVLIDQLVSPIPGLIAQMTGFLTTKRYKYATVLWISSAGWVLSTYKRQHWQETIEAKKAFESYAKRHGVNVENYLANNGMFKAHK